MLTSHDDRQEKALALLTKAIKILKVEWHEDKHKLKLLEVIGPLFPPTMSVQAWLDKIEDDHFDVNDVNQFISGLQASLMAGETEHVDAFIKSISQVIKDYDERLKDYQARCASIRKLRNEIWLNSCVAGLQAAKRSCDLLTKMHAQGQQVSLTAGSSVNKFLYQKGLKLDTIAECSEYFYAKHEEAKILNDCVQPTIKDLEQFIKNEIAHIDKMMAKIRSIQKVKAGNTVDRRQYEENQLLIGKFEKLKGELAYNLSVSTRTSQGMQKILQRYKAPVYDGPPLTTDETKAINEGMSTITNNMNSIQGGLQELSRAYYQANALFADMELETKDQTLKTYDKALKSYEILRTECAKIAKSVDTIHRDDPHYMPAKLDEMPFRPGGAASEAEQKKRLQDSAYHAKNLVPQIKRLLDSEISRLKNHLRKVDVFLLMKDDAEFDQLREEFLAAIKSLSHSKDQFEQRVACFKDHRNLSEIAKYPRLDDVVANIHLACVQLPMLYQRKMQAFATLHVPQPHGDNIPSTPPSTPLAVKPTGSGGTLGTLFKHANVKSQATTIVPKASSPTRSTFLEDPSRRNTSQRKEKGRKSKHLPDEVSLLDFGSDETSRSDDSPRREDSPPRKPSPREKK